MNSKHFDLTQERLKEVFDYDPLSGNFIWIEALRKGRRGVIAGTLHPHGYVYVKVDKVKYRAHRLTWLWFHGVIPNEDIDHKNRVRSDNRIENLRLSTASQNGANSKLRSDNTSGFKGVFFKKKTGNWLSKIHVNGKTVTIGTFKTDVEAAAMYDDSAIKAFGEFARTNVSYV